MVDSALSKRRLRVSLINIFIRATLIKRTSHILILRCSLIQTLASSTAIASIRATNSSDQPTARNSMDIAKYFDQLPVAQHVNEGGTEMVVVERHRFRCLYVLSFLLSFLPRSMRNL
jgi:hypothetical protein